MLRALSEDMKVSFTNNDRTNEFVITINKPEGNQVNGKLDTKLGHSDTDLGTNSDTFNADSDTKLRHSDTGLDTGSDTKCPKIANKQRDIVNFWGQRTMQQQKNFEMAGVTYHSKNIQTYIMALVEAGYLEMTNPKHPNASNQKYKKKK